MYMRGFFCIISNYMGTHTSASDDIRRILDSIRQIVQVLRLSAAQTTKQLGLSAAQLFVLHKLGDGQAISVNELARRTHTHQSSVSVVIQRLVELKLVRRERSQTDGRQLNLSITSIGQRKLSRAPEAAQDRFIHSLQKIRGARRKQLALLLEQLVAGTGISQGIPGLFFEDNIKLGKENKHG
jgi:DNA-binding MarR family transcriptional regulator